MSYEPKRSTFDELVAGLSADERKLLLKNMNQNREQEILIMQSDREEETGFLDIKFKNEPLLYKLILWIRSIFTKEIQRKFITTTLFLPSKSRNPISAIICFLGDIHNVIGLLSVVNYVNPVQVQSNLSNQKGLKTSVFNKLF